MSLRIFLICIALSAMTCISCSGADARHDAPVGVEKTAQKPLTPTEEATRSVRSWHGELASWHGTHPMPFASEGHETSASTLSINPLAQGIYGSAGPYPVGAALAHSGTPTTQAESGPHTWMMVKMDPGYDPEGHDWYYAAFDATGVITLAGPGADPAVGEACGGCHRFGAGGTDFVFGVPQEAR